MLKVKRKFTAHKKIYNISDIVKKPEDLIEEKEKLIATGFLEDTSKKPSNKMVDPDSVKKRAV